MIWKTPLQCKLAKKKERDTKALRSSRVVEAWAVLTPDGGDIVVRRGIRPNEVELGARVCRRGFVAKGGDEIRKNLMFPADKDVAFAIVAIDDLLHASAVVALAGGVDFDAQRRRQRLNRIIGSLLRTTFDAWIRPGSLNQGDGETSVDAAGRLTFLRLLGHDVLDIVFRFLAKHVHETLRTLDALWAQAVPARRLLAMSDKVDGGRVTVLLVVVARDRGGRWRWRWCWNGTNEGAYEQGKDKAGVQHDGGREA